MAKTNSRALADQFLTTKIVRYFPTDDYVIERITMSLEDFLSLQKLAQLVQEEME